MDGLTTGVIYALLGLAVVLVFSVTRVLLVPQGEFVSYGALTMAALQSQQFPATAMLVVALAMVCFVVEAMRMVRSRIHYRAKAWAGLVVRDVLLPWSIYVVTRYCAAQDLGLVAQAALTLLLVVPLGSMVYRLAFEPVAQASTLTLLIISISVHFAMMGLGLVMFGPEGVQTTPFVEGGMMLAAVFVKWQTVVVLSVALVLVIALYLYFGHSFMGKALKATSVNRMGARLVGIDTARAGRLTFMIAAALGAVSGMLIAPLTVVYYDSGFIMSLKGFVGAVFGGLLSYPLAALGAGLVGMIESWASFLASAYKEVIVFTLIIPLLLWLSLARGGHDEEEEEA